MPGIGFVVQAVVWFAILSLALLIGLSLGLLGGGGSLLTVPLLAYVAGMSPPEAIASSLFVVAVTSVAGVIAHRRHGTVRWRLGLVFGGVGMIGAYAGARASTLFSERWLMAMFGLVMAASAISMLVRRRSEPPREDVAVGKGILLGLVTGGLSGLVGAGGGFIIVPTLVLLGGLRIESAIATSLVVIALQALSGFVGHIGHTVIDWPVTLAVSGMAVIGSILGARLARRIPPSWLRHGFGVLVFVMAAVVLVSELL